MKIVWEIEQQDIERVQRFVTLHLHNALVQERIERNLKQSKHDISRSEFWYVMVSCLLTTQQRSSSEGKVSQLINAVPFPLTYEVCRLQNDLRGFVQNTLSNFGGIRRVNIIANEIAANLQHLELGLWDKTFEILNNLRSDQTIEGERKAAAFIDDNFKGFGPKQSRNLLQSLGLTKYEIPLDSRVTKWLNEFGFPIHLSAQALSDRNYYHFVSDGFQQLCTKSGIYPCVLDAAIFVSFDKE